MQKFFRVILGDIHNDVTTIDLFIETKKNDGRKFVFANHSFQLIIREITCS